jgi:organic hydroperoxide reductase OsmC/OhrA
VLQAENALASDARGICKSAREKSTDFDRRIFRRFRAGTLQSPKAAVRADRFQSPLCGKTDTSFWSIFGPAVAKCLADEPLPLGEGAGPAPTQLLAAAVANFLSSSLVFARARSKEDPGHLVITVSCEIGRKERNRLRVTEMNITITLGLAPDQLPHFSDALQQFDDFCTVSQSVRNGIPYSLTVKPGRSSA